MCDRSHARAAAATAGGRFAREIVKVDGVDSSGVEVAHAADEGIRGGASYAALSALKPLRGEGVITAGTSSQVRATSGAPSPVRMQG